MQDLKQVLIELQKFKEPGNVIDKARNFSVHPDTFQVLEKFKTMDEQLTKLKKDVNETRNNKEIAKKEFEFIKEKLKTIHSKVINAQTAIKSCKAKVTEDLEKGKMDISKIASKT